MPNPSVSLRTTLGDVRLEIYRDRAPRTAENFLTLARKQFYVGLSFHRVIPGFMVQTGCPKGDGTGGPGYEIPDEFGAGLRHDSAGVVSMANAGPNTGGSQFFITLAATPWLDGKHAIFGHVRGGLDTVEKIGGVPRDGNDRPRSPVRIVEMTISGA
jgi:cyclophilin family peptidyl-prolyl cis-trans isomerase